MHITGEFKHALAEREAARVDWTLTRQAVVRRAALGCESPEDANRVACLLEAFRIKQGRLNDEWAKIQPDQRLAGDTLD